MTFRERLVAFELELQRRMPEFKCSVHLCLGQEAVPEALAGCILPEDYLFSTHRSHGHYIAKGGKEEAILAEIEGRAEGVNRGYSGSQSYSDPALRFHSTAIVGGLCTAAVGAALAVKLKGLPEIVVCCIGDAATEQGAFWEALNFAALHALPIVFICENNGLSVHAPLYARQATTLRNRVDAFGATYEHGAHWIAPVIMATRERKGRRPYFVEVECKRECAHVSAMEDLRE